MFKCQMTGKTTEPGEKMRKVISVSRERIYKDEYDNEVGRGSEVVIELSLSEEGYKKWMAINAPPKEG